MNEHDTRENFIDPALKLSGWPDSQIRREYAFTDGRIIVQGRTSARDSPKRADYLLTHEPGTFPLAVIEAKSMEHSTGSGIQQALEYAEILGSPFAYSSSGREFLEHDMLTGHERIIPLDAFPSPAELWSRYTGFKGLDADMQKVITQPYYYDSFRQVRPRYYQSRAVDAALEAVAFGKKRILLVMATGTGKTFTAFQIVYRLRMSGKVKRVLYLADRNLLIGQTMDGDFKPFERVMTKVQGKKLDSAYEIFMCLYQQLSDDERRPYEAFTPDFFDLVIVDECHRGSADANSQWRSILEYFSPAIQIGMTATPKETEDISTTKYFGEPVYTYSLKQGIDDGFLAPYKVIRPGLNTDLESWRPHEGQLDTEGNEIEDRIYGVNDFDRTIIIDDRTHKVAERITQWLNDNGRYSKAIVFCVDIDHAERMRQALVNLNADITAEHPKYIQRATGNEQEGIIKTMLGGFRDNDAKEPSVLTTSELLTTGVDAKGVKLIVIDCVIKSMTKFKQIIGRGTRLDTLKGKNFFTIMDFRGACDLFYDPDFDGYPVPAEPTDKKPEPPGNHETVQKPKREIIRVNGVDVRIISERVEYISPITGKLITESITDYSRRNMLGQFATLNDFLSVWNASGRKEALTQELAARGVFIAALREEAGEAAKDIDDFDIIARTAYGVKALTRRERAEHVRSTGLPAEYSGECRKVIEALIDKYADSGITELESVHVLNTSPFDMIGSPSKIVKLFGGADKYKQAVRKLTQKIYEAA